MASATAAPLNAAASLSALPAVVRDPRFRAGRALVRKGAGTGAVSIFATLLQEARQKYGASHVESVPAYYEYGNALFRSRPMEYDNDEEKDQPPESSVAIDKRREAAAMAAEKRSAVGEDDRKPAATPSAASADDIPSSSDTKEEKEVKEEEEADDVQLALELMETAWSILDEYLSPDNKQTVLEYKSWATEQVPRVLTGIGDVLSALGRHADAADAYARALGHRQAALALFDKGQQEGSLQHLQARRRVTEALVLIAEEFLACPPDEDVITTESETLLCKAGAIKEYARGYYDKARDELQEAVLLMGQLAGSSTTAKAELEEEKQDVCFVATMVMGVGTQLAELDEIEAEAAKEEPSKKKQKKIG